MPPITPPKDGDYINFTQDYELDYVLGHHLARDESKPNRALLVQIGDDYKKDKKVDRAKHEKPFYDYVRKHALFVKMI
jgi:hypothetical protein